MPVSRKTSRKSKRSRKTKSSRKSKGSRRTKLSRKSKTSRKSKISRKSKTERKCRLDEIINPETGRCVKMSGKIGKKLMEKSGKKSHESKKPEKHKSKSETHLDYISLLKARSSAIDNDDTILEDTKPMIRYFKKMLRYGVITTNGQGGDIIDEFLKDGTKFVQEQRPYLTFSFPLATGASFEIPLQLIKGLNDLGYVILDDSIGFIVPPGKESLVEVASLDAASFFSKSFVGIEKSTTYRASVQFLRVNLTRTKMEKKNSGKWLYDTNASSSSDRSENLSYLGDIPFDGLETENVRRLIDKMYDNFVVLTVIHPEYGADTIKFVSNISEVIAKHFKRLF